jgi:excisionase family DNA binding protein
MSDIRMMSVKEAAEFSGTSEYFIRLAVRQKRFHFVKAGSKILISEKVLRAYLEGDDGDKE